MCLLYQLYLILSKNVELSLVIASNFAIVQHKWMVGSKPNDALKSINWPLYVIDSQSNETVSYTSIINERLSFIDCLKLSKPITSSTLKSRCKNCLRNYGK